MHTPVEMVFQAVRQQQYDEVINLIKKNPELVNAIEPKRGYSLFAYSFSDTMKPNDPKQPMIDFILTHPKFDFDFKNGNNFTNLTTIIFSARVDVLDLIIKNPKILMNGDQLTYEYATAQLQSSTRGLQRDLNKNPNSKSSERSKVRVADLKEMVDMLRDATILGAMEQDKPELLDLLDKAGGKPLDFLGKLGNGKLPAALVKKSNVNVIEWFEKQAKKTASNRNAFWEKIEKREQVVQKLEQKKATLEKEYHAQRTNLHNKEIKSTINLIDGMQSKLKL